MPRLILVAIGFSLLRGAEKREVLAIFPGPTVLQPVIGNPIKNRKKLLDLGMDLKDGVIVAGKSFDAAVDALRGGA